MKVRLAALVILAALLIVAGLSTSDRPLGEILQRLFTAAFTRDAQTTDMLRRLVPLCLLGLAVFWALRAGLFNIGVEGQFLMGGLAAAPVALAMPGLGGSALAVVAGGIAGALWAYPAAWIKARRGGHEVISTIMLNQIAVQVALWFLNGPLQAPGAGFPTSATLPSNSMVAYLTLPGGAKLSFSVFLAIAAVLAFGWWMTQTLGGFELRLTGSNPVAAQFAGVEVPGKVASSLVGSGAVAGVAGGLYLIAFEGRFFDGFSSGFGFDAIGVAILAGSAPWALIPSALAFAVLATGASSLQMMKVPAGMSGILVAVLVVVFSAVRYSRQGERRG